MADKTKKKLGDYMEIMLPAFGNQIATIYRDETKNEEQWQQAKAAAQESGTLRTLKEGQTQTSGQRWDRSTEGDMLEVRDPMTGVVAKIPRGDIPERRWKALKDQSAKGDTTLDWNQNKNWDQPDPPVQVPNVKRRIIGPDGQEGPVTDAMAPVPGAGSFFSKMLGEASKGAIPGPGPEMTGGGAAGPGDQAPPAPEQPFSMTGIPEGSGTDPLAAVGSFAAEVPGRVKQFGQFLSDRPLEPEPGRPVGVDGTRLGDPLDQTGAPAPQPGIDPNATSQKVGITQQTVTPGAGGGGGLEADLNKSYADQARAKAELAKQEADKSAEIAQQEISKAKSLDIAERARAAKAQSIVEEQNKLIAAQMKVAESLNERLKVDPKRLWNNRTAQQKADAKLAGFLFGLAGNGADYVRSLQQEVQNDIQTQIQEFEADRASKTAQANILGNAFAQYRQMGLDAATSAEAAKASILDIHATKLNEIAARYNGTSAGARAAEAVAALGVERVAAMDKLKNSAAQRASLSMARKLDALELEAKIAAKQAGAAGGALPATLKAQLGEIDSYIIELERMKEYASGGVGERALTQLASMTGPGGVPIGGSMLSDKQAERRAKAQSFANGIVSIKKNIVGGTLQKAEMDMLSGTLPENITAFEDPTRYLDNAIQTAKKIRAAKEATFQGAQHDTRGPSSASNYQGGE